MWYVSSYQPYPCNGCNDLIQKAMNFDDVDVDYGIHLRYMSKANAINITGSTNLNEKRGVFR